MEVCINMRVFKACLLLMVLLVAVVVVNVDAGPLPHHHLRDEDVKPDERNCSETDSYKEPLTDHYDQRQNGSENYRVKVDGLVFIMAPADTLLLAGAALEPNFTSLFSEGHRFKPKPEKDDLAKPKGEPKDDLSKLSLHEHNHLSHKPALRITNLLAPFISRLTSLAKSDRQSSQKSAADISR